MLPRICRGASVPVEIGQGQQSRPGHDGPRSCKAAGASADSSQLSRGMDAAQKYGILIVDILFLS